MYIKDNIIEKLKIKNTDIVTKMQKILCNLPIDIEKV